MFRQQLNPVGEEVLRSQENNGKGKNENEDTKFIFGGSMCFIAGWKC